jgi:hypothetical protein
MASILRAPALAQAAGSDTSPTAPTGLKVTAADRAAAASAEFRYHLTPARTDAGASAALNGPEPLSLDKLAAARATAEAVQPLLSKVPQPGFYPADLSFFDGNTIKTAVFQNVYLGCADGNCWGNPQRFEQDLVKSRFLHVVDKYVGATANNRYSVGTEMTPGSVASNCTSSSFCSQIDIMAIALAASATGGTGKGHLYHIFLPQGTDTCFAGNTQCYSPANLSTFTFCGYHGAVTSGPSTTYFTVQPYQDVDGCAVSTLSPAPPNGQQADSTNSVLSHEIFESLTDPDLGSGWLAINSLNELGFEIADECQGPPDDSGHFDALVPVFAINGHRYKIQLEYSNKYHACSASP